MRGAPAWGQRNGGTFGKISVLSQSVIQTTSKPVQQQSKNIAVIGLGKLGSCLAAVLASKGHKVVGVDINEGFVEALNNGQAPVVEAQLSDFIAEHQQRLSATTSIQEAIAGCDMSFVIVPTPSNDEGVFVLDYVLPVVEQIGLALKDKDDYHVVAITSTVMPGHTGGAIRSVLEQSSGKTCGQGFGLCYSPEFIALGSVIRDMLHPDMILIGESDPRAGDHLASVLGDFRVEHTQLLRMNWVNAELTKIAVNTYVTTKISYANMLSQICEQIPGADSDVVTHALGHDQRIGAKYIKGALAFGGPCFPRDNRAFSQMARRHGVEAIVAEATDRQNMSQIAHLTRRVLEQHQGQQQVAILGLSYKPGTVVVDESPGIQLALDLIERQIPLRLYDPQALDNARKTLPEGAAVEFASSVEDCVAGAGIVVIAVPWAEFKELSAEHFQSEETSQPVVIDCWRILDRGQVAEAVTWQTMGLGPQL